MTSLNDARSHYEQAIYQARTARQILDRGARPTLEKLADLADARDAIDAAIHNLVQTARLDDESWSTIGQWLGVTKQAAQQRYGAKPKNPEPADDGQRTIDEALA